MPFREKRDRVACEFIFYLNTNIFLYHADWVICPIQLDPIDTDIHLHFTKKIHGVSPWQITGIFKPRFCVNDGQHSPGHHKTKKKLLVINAHFNMNCY